MNRETRTDADVVLLVDDDDDILRILELILERAGYRVLMARSASEGLRLARTGGPDLAIVDWRLPDITGLELLRELKLTLPQLPVILLTGFANLEGAVAAIKEGAYDYLAKPLNNRDFLLKVQDALAHRSRAVSAFSGRDALVERMGTSPAITRTIEDIQRVARTDFSVNLFGETGAGKEVVAHAIHEASPRAAQPFIAVDCGAIPESLIENELFGHERGAFTGADRQQAGRFEAARGGTLFLDEITNLSLGAQARLLRVLQERVIYRVGGSKPISVDVRLISASNRHLTEAVSEGQFRPDLLYRLSDYRIAIPPLRDRREDILHIANQFLVDANRDLGKNIQNFTEKAVAAMVTYPWPGNVRELRSVVRRAVLIAQCAIDVQHLDLPGGESVWLPESPGFDRPIDPEPECDGRSFKEIVRTRVEQLERQVLLHALKCQDGNKAAVARMLQLDYKTVHTKLKAYGLAV